MIFHPVTASAVYLLNIQLFAITREICEQSKDYVRTIYIADRAKESAVGQNLFFFPVKRLFRLTFGKTIFPYICQILDAFSFFLFSLIRQIFSKLVNCCLIFCRILSVAISLRYVGAMIRSFWYNRQR